jgi:hypothetical protein
MIRFAAMTMYLVFSQSGKPIFVYHRGIRDASGYAVLVATAQALLSFAENSALDLRSFESPTRVLQFLSKPPLSLLAITTSSIRGAALQNRLALLHAQLVSLLTLPAIHGLYDKQPGYDLRRLLVGSGERVLGNLIEGFEGDACGWLGAVRVAVVEAGHRRKVGNGVRHAIEKTGSAFGVLYGDGGKLIWNSSSKSVSTWISSWDLMLLRNLCGALSGEQEEAVTPVCLPMYDSRGNFYAYVRRRLGTNHKMTMVLLSGTPVSELEVFRGASAEVVACECKELELDKQKAENERTNPRPCNFVFKNSRMQQYASNDVVPRGCSLEQILVRYERMRLGMFSRRDGAGGVERGIEKPEQGFRMERFEGHVYVAFASEEAELYVCVEAEALGSDAAIVGFATSLRESLVRQRHNIFFSSVQ